MKIHSDELTTAAIAFALRDAKMAGKVPSLVMFTNLEQVGSRKRANAFDVHLHYAGDKVPGVKRGYSQVSQTPAATYFEWGWWMVELFNIDPDAIVGPYKGVSDFHEKTRYQFA